MFYNVIAAAVIIVSTIVDVIVVNIFAGNIGKLVTNSHLIQSAKIFRYRQELMEE